jgi:type I restriction enzyme R subunit
MTAKQFLEHLYGDLSSLILDEDSLRQQWSDPNKRQHFIEVLEERGYDQNALDDMRKLIDAPDSDLFDVLAYIRFNNPTKTRAQRADRVEESLSGEDNQQMRDFLTSILEAYKMHGERELGTEKLTSFLTARFGTLADARRMLGEIPKIRDAYIELQRDLYEL